MKISLIQFGAVFVTILGHSGILAGQTPTSPVQQAAFVSNENVDTVATSVKRIGFRVVDWKTIHSHNEMAAQADVETLKQIGCEVTTNNHGNHIDVRYRCSQWKTMEVPTDELSAQWSTWMATKGMETVVVSPPADTQGHTVNYRLVTARTLHLHDPQKSAQIMGTLKMIGVEVSSRSHGNHIDAVIHCPQWKTIELPSDEQAHSWQKWLDEAGFETQHTH